jgi:hypothetical protein
VEVITRLFAGGLLVWFGLLAMLITVRVLRGDITAVGMLSESSAGERVTPERVVAMTVVPTVLLMYVLTALQVDVRGDPRLPDIPEALVSLLTASNGLYLAGKIARHSGGAR